MIKWLTVASAFLALQIGMATASPYPLNNPERTATGITLIKSKTRVAPGKQSTQPKGCRDRCRCGCAWNACRPCDDPEKAQ